MSIEAQQTTETVRWRARMITPVADLTAPLFRREVSLDEGHGPVRRAVLHLSSHGINEAFINGEPVSQEVLAPGWSAYEWRLRYRSHDVTQLISEDFVMVVTLGNGWWRGRLAFIGGQSLYGDRLGLIAQLEVEFGDGHVQVVSTDKSWVACPSDTLADDLYDGQTIDARRREPDWHRVGAQPRPSAPAVEVELDLGRLVPAIGPPVTRQETLLPVSTWRSPSGRLLVDFGQNLVGWVRTTVQGPRGSEVRLRHAEVLEDGELGVRPLRDAQATDHFILSGEVDVFEPTMTFHGFRYVEVSGWPGDLAPDALEAVVVHSDLRRTGTFECSNPALTQFHRNVVWGLRGNMVGVPTDCPQRNERLGWTGDISAFAPSAVFLYDASDFLADWLADLAVEQEHADGMVAYVVPDVLKMLPPPEGLGEPDSTALWSDAACWVPWALWEAYGDRVVLESQYPSMRAHIERVSAKLSPAGLWDTGFQFGDWLDPDAPPSDPGAAKADKGVVATACFYRSLRIAEQTAAILGHADEEIELAALAQRVRSGFLDAYVSTDGTILSDCATVYTLAIVLDLLDPSLEAAAGKRLAELVSEAGHRISTGFAGTPFVCEALSRTGHLSDAYTLLVQRDCPSWLYQVDMGATTVWERWDSMLPDGSINPGQMTSFNHYALGAVADWVHRTVAGIAPGAPGYDTVDFAPRPGGDLTWAESTLSTRHGDVAIRWEVAGDELSVRTTLPEGVVGSLSLPDGQVRPVASGVQDFVARR